MSAFESVLVYDGDCPFCSAASSALRRTRGVGVVQWEAASAQRFLEAQFGEVPFALAFVDREAERVYVGREAARELCERAGLPVLVSDLVGENYESIADAIRTVSGLDGDPDPLPRRVPAGRRGRRPVRRARGGRRGTRSRRRVSHGESTTASTTRRSACRSRYWNVERGTSSASLRSASVASRGVA